MEAEYIAAAQITRVIIWLRGLLKEIGLWNRSLAGGPHHPAHRQPISHLPLTQHTLPREV